ncbi:MAG: hypothetical protein QG557_288, partial [Pseudomonadota bacterium]|nr:hypothetical protein [Pseudomonadota bacterium]
TLNHNVSALIAQFEQAQQQQIQQVNALLQASNAIGSQQLTFESGSPLERMLVSGDSIK